ncbi:MAG TPA: hypothetical protein VKQ72_07005 [Aggregatilineales bacterium]|nr:hypothetical protein [Aggregatilineales bacterium]
MTEMSKRFFEWDYEQGVVILYERLGECNGCGDCCMAAIRFSVAGKLAGGNSPWDVVANGGPDTDGHGVWSEVQADTQRRFFKITQIVPGSTPCEQLTEDKRCKIHDVKPLFHKSWPMSPRQVTPFERCSYSFRELARWPIADLNQS